MSGSTLTMAPALFLDSSASGAFHRSHSSPDLLNHVESPQDPRCLPSLPSFEVPSFDFSSDLDTRLFLDGKDVALADPQKGGKAAGTEDAKSKHSKRYSLVDRPKSWLVSSKSATNIRDFLADRPSMDSWDRGDSRGVESHPGMEQRDRAKTMTDSLSNIRRKSWISLSRPASPHDSPGSPADAGPAPNKLRKVAAASEPVKAPTQVPAPAQAPAVQQSTRKRAMSALEPGTPPPEDHKESTRSLTRASNYLTKIKPKHAVFGKGATTNDSDTSCSSSATSLALPTTTTFTVEHQGTFKTASFVDSSATSLDSDDMAPQRDPLWNVFKNLELESRRLVNLNTAQRVQMVRVHLVGFLRSSAAQGASSKNLHPDDLDRRASILDAWWKTLLDMIDGRVGQPLAGTERPIVLEAATLLMERPEWRLATSCFLPLAERSPNERVRSRSWGASSTASLSSDQDDFLASSAEHNVRNMFVANLTAQMELVVAKLTLNHAPLSLVSWCAKACAYAFFFAPGVADVLVRLWNVPSDRVARVADELGLPRRDRGESDDIAALFPPNLGSVGWSSAKEVSMRLQVVPRLPMAVARIQWYYGRWLARWRGMETDLFYIFVKYFHVLADEFMPPGLPLVERARSPAFVLVQTQMLTVLEAAIHRPGGAMPMMMFDSAYDPDGMSMGGRGGNGRGMPDNLLMVLVKNFLADTSAHVASARDTFAESFLRVLRAAVKRTSVFTSHACMALCDILEEVLHAFNQFDGSEHPGLDYIDWAMLLDVARRMSGSMNFNTDTRLLSFIYMAWDAITADPARKEALCLGWLLTEEVFDKYFNHWSTMVRAYYMRLLCWRMCRDAGRANELDTKIFITASARLKTAWSHYGYLKLTAERNGTMPPSTVPCPPAPYKIMLIRAVELSNAPQAPFVSFDALAKPPAEPVTPEPKPGNKKRWSLLGKVLTLNAPPPEDPLEQTRRETAVARTRPSSATPPPPPPKPSASAASSDDSSAGSSPFDAARTWRFELETFTYSPPHTRALVLSRPRLPAPAQSRVSARSRSGSNPPPPAARMPAPTRKVSGLNEGGLVSGARNASPSSSPASPSATAPQLTFSPSLVRTLSEPLDGGLSPSVSEGSIMTASSGGSATADAVRPTGHWKGNATYTGRALAEWALVVAECNAFVESRRGEGVLGLAEVEVPMLLTQSPRQMG